MQALTIILPTYNRRHVLERTLASYLVLARHHALLVIDDGSHDGTSEWLRTQGVAVLQRRDHLGLPAARNLGLRLARTPWVLFGEDDVMMPEDHGRILLEEAARLSRFGQVGAVAGRLFSTPAFVLPAQTPPASPHPLLDCHLLTGDFAAALPTSVPLPTLHACALIARETALAIGGYDERYVLSAFREESDFYARLWRHGQSCWLTPACWSVHVRHRLGGGCRGGQGLLSKLGSRMSYLYNHLRFATRHSAVWRCWCRGARVGASSVGWSWRILIQAIQAWRA
jgi:GT2 family glycosyltransferase